MPTNPLPLKKILVIRFSSIGDIVLTTPVIRCLHRQAPAEIHYLTKPAFAPMLTANPFIAKVHTLNRPTGTLIKDLRSEKFDLVVDLHKNLRSLHFLLRLRRPYVQFDKLNTEKWMLTTLRINRLPSKHLVDRYFEALTSEGIQNDGLGLDVFIPEKDKVQTVEWDRVADTPFAVVVLGAAHATKQMPEELLRAILQETQCPLILLGGVQEQHLGARLVQFLHRGDVISMAGSLSILQSASIIQQATAVLTPDTGMMHIAAALGKPIVSVWGNTVPAFGMHPYYAEQSNSGEFRFEVSGLRCRPCSKIGHAHCPKGHFKCMRDHSPKQIASTLARIVLG